MNKQTLDCEMIRKYRTIETSALKLLGQKCEILSCVLPGFVNIVSTKIKHMTPLINVNKQVDCLTAKELQENGIMNVHLCINAETNTLHTEADSTMTIIGVPSQPDPKYGTLNQHFCFAVTKSETIIIPMKQHLTFSFLGYMLNHRQIIENDQNDHVFINIASYGNKRLFHNMLKSIKRNMEIIKT